MIIQPSIVYGYILFPLYFDGKNLAMWKMFPIIATINREMFQNLKGFSFKKNEPNYLRMSSVSMLLSAPVIEHNTGR